MLFLISKNSVNIAIGLEINFRIYFIADILTCHWRKSGGDLLQSAIKCTVNLELVCSSSSSSCASSSKLNMHIISCWGDYEQILKKLFGEGWHGPRNTLDFDKDLDHYQDPFLK